MHGIRAGPMGRLDDPLDGQIALAGGRGPNEHSRIGLPGMRRVGVSLREDGYRPDPEAPARAKDRDGRSRPG